MPATRDKYYRLQALRRDLSLPGGAVDGNKRCQPVENGRLDPALFASGLHDIFGETPADAAAATAFALIAAGQRKLRRRALFFATTSHEHQERGMLYGAGLGQLGLDPAKICLLVAPSEKALLWAAEEAASTPALAACVLVLPASDRLYGFTESRRLKLRQEKSGVPLFIVRSRPREASAASARWRVAFAPSQGTATPGSPVPLLGPPRFRVRLEQFAGLAPLQWEIECDEAHALRVAAPVLNRPAAMRESRDQRAA